MKYHPLRDLIAPHEKIAFLCYRNAMLARAHAKCAGALRKARKRKEK